MNLKYKLWAVNEKKMYDVASICFGDDGAALTITITRAPKPKYVELYVQGENGILLQYTGLKDIKGVEIFEASTLKIQVPYGTKNVKVIRGSRPFETTGFYIDEAINILTRQPLTQHFIDICKVQVIGDDYQNPELLEQ